MGFMVQKLLTQFTAAVLANVAVTGDSRELDKTQTENYGYICFKSWQPRRAN